MTAANIVLIAKNVEVF